MPTKLRAGSGGRPPKFREPRHPVTMTLPERILDLLADIDPDRACAVVKAAEAVAGGKRARFRAVELVTMAPGKCLIVIGPCKALRRISWLRLIEIYPSRYLLTIPSGTPIEVLEVALRDLTREPESRGGGSDVLAELLSLIEQQRRTRQLSKAEILIIDSGAGAGGQGPQAGKRG